MIRLNFLYLLFNLIYQFKIRVKNLLFEIIGQTTSISDVRSSGNIFRTCKTSRVLVLTTSRPFKSAKLFFVFHRYDASSASSKRWVSTENCFWPKILQTNPPYLTVLTCNEKTKRVSVKKRNNVINFQPSSPSFTASKKKQKKKNRVRIAHDHQMPRFYRKPLKLYRNFLKFFFKNNHHNRREKFVLRQQRDRYRWYLLLINAFGQ